MWRICVGCESAEAGEVQLYPQLWAQANVVSGCFGNANEQWLIAQDRQCRNMGALRRGNPNSTYIASEVQHHMAQKSESLFQRKAKHIFKIQKRLAQKPCQTSFLSIYLFLSVFTLCSLLSEVVPTWRPLCSLSMATIHRLTCIYFLRSAFLSFSLSGFFASHSSSEPETSDNSLAAICEGLCKPPGLRQCCPAVKRWWDGWEYPDILQAMKGLWVLTSSSICRACTGRETWQWLQREYGDSQGRRKWALAGTFVLTFSRLCLGRSANWHKPFLASLFCILVGDSF